MKTRRPVANRLASGSMIDFYHVHTILKCSSGDTGKLSEVLNHFTLLWPERMPALERGVQ